MWRLRPVEQILGYARGGRATSRRRSTADRFGIYRVVRLVREDEAA